MRKKKLRAAAAAGVAMDGWVRDKKVIGACPINRLREALKQDARWCAVVV